MSDPARWYLVSYDMRDPARYRELYKIIRGYGSRLQYSVFRVRGTGRQIEQLRFELHSVMEPEDDLLIIPLCRSCAQRVRQKNAAADWPDDDPPFEILG